MKKLWITLVALLLIVSSVGASAEEREAILFRGIPWGVSLEEAVTLLTDGTHWPKGVLHEFDVTCFEVTNSAKAIDGGYIYFTDLAQYGSTDSLLRVGGHPVRTIELYALKECEDNKIISSPNKSTFYKAAYYFDYDEAVYSDLIDKLTAIYGESKHVKNQNGLLECECWYGGDNTGVVLCNKWGTLYLGYGLTNSYELIEELNRVQFLSSSDVSGL